MINYFSVQNDLEENGWQLVSTEYKNLKTPLKMICPKGHEVEDDYGHWRKYHICEKCLGGKGNKIRKEVPPKKKEHIAFSPLTRRQLLLVSQSMTMVI